MCVYVCGGVYRRAHMFTPVCAHAPVLTPACTRTCQATRPPGLSWPLQESKITLCDGTSRNTANPNWQPECVCAGERAPAASREHARAASCLCHVGAGELSFPRAAGTSLASPPQPQTARVTPASPPKQLGPCLPTPSPKLRTAGTTPASPQNPELPAPPHNTLVWLHLKGCSPRARSLSSCPPQEPLQGAEGVSSLSPWHPSS